MVTARPQAEIGAQTVPDVAPDEAEPTEGEVTQVRVRPTELYSVEIWRGGVRQTVVPVSKAEITIGRGSKSVAVDLPIKGDPEVSRVHAVLAHDPDGKYWLTAKGRNPTLVNGRELPREESTEVAPDAKIEICSYTLRIQPK
jgi:pSer/pThr/pTyr-binding forkhead associated (FHA) protein